MLEEKILKKIDKKGFKFIVKEEKTYNSIFNFNKEMKSILLTEEQFNKIVKQELTLLTEKLHISNDVTNAYEYLKQLILTDLNKTELKTNVLSIPFKNNELNVNIFGYDLTIKYHCYYLNSSMDIGEILNHLDIVSHVDNNDKILVLNFINIDNEFIDPRYFDDALQHELEHFYQFVKKGGTDLIPNKTLYNQALKYLKDTEGNNGFNYILSLIIYLSYKQEWDGFINGSYAMITSCDIRTKQDFDYYLKQTEAYRYLQNLKYYQQVLKEHETDENLLNALKTVSTKTLKWYNRTIDYSIKNITKKLNGMKQLYLKNKQL